MGYIEFGQKCFPFELMPNGPLDMEFDSGVGPTYLIYCQTPNSITTQLTPTKVRFDFNMNLGNTPTLHRNPTSAKFFLFFVIHIYLFNLSIFWIQDLVYSDHILVLELTFFFFNRYLVCIPDDPKVVFR